MSISIIGGRIKYSAIHSKRHSIADISEEGFDEPELSLAVALIGEVSHDILKGDYAWVCEWLDTWFNIAGAGAALARCFENQKKKTRHKEKSMV
ncbi:MAG: hypothetical protein WCY09_09490 [Candidatus Omnitrophota bacterium]